MAIESSTADVAAPSYRSGAAARLAGIPVETLRVWERRYRMVGPRLGPRGHRLYSSHDVSRLTLIKRLVDLGSPVGSIANLPLDALRAMCSHADEAARGTGVRSTGAAPPVRVAVVGDSPPGLTSAAGAVLPALEIVAQCRGLAGAAEALRGVAVDVVVIVTPTLQAESVAVVDNLVDSVGARRAVVAYRYGPAAVVGALRDRGHRVTRAPLDPIELEELCRGPAASAALGAGRSALPLEAIPKRRFDDEGLARIARSSATLYCECPRHVVDLLLDLGSFERYSAECANRGPADALLHRYLQRVAATARALLEDALARVAQAEGIALPVVVQRVV